MAARGVPVHEEQTPEQKRDELIENIVAITVVTLLVAAGIWIFLWARAPKELPAVTPTAQIYPVEIEGDATLGNLSAKVTIISFSDYACPACADFEQSVFPQLKAAYIDTGRVSYTFRDFPLQIHEQSFPAAVAADCADEQRQFWPYHDELFQHSAELSNETFLAIATDLGLDLERFQACIASGRHDEEVRRDYIAGINQGGVTGTPTFFINGHRLVGNQPFSVFQDAIDRELANP